jgi:putative flippase GtrA
VIERIKALLHAHGDKLLFLVVGGVNTVFSFVLFAVMLWAVAIFVPDVRGDWLKVDLVLFASWLISVTFSWSTFKLFVFRTRGTDWVREWRRAYMVYTPSLVMNLGVLAALVGLLHVPPLVGQAAWALVMAVYSYIAHRWFTFGTPEGTPEEEPTSF